MLMTRIKDAHSTTNGDTSTSWSTWYLFDWIFCMRRSEGLTWGLGTCSVSSCELSLTIWCLNCMVTRSNCSERHSYVATGFGGPGPGILQWAKDLCLVTTRLADCHYAQFPLTSNWI